MEQAGGAEQATPLTRALETIRRLRAQLDEQRESKPVAIVGVGLRLPGGADDLESYRDVLVAGQDLVRRMPPDRTGPFSADWDRLPRNGGFIDDPLGFDAGFFGIGLAEARRLDPQHRLLLEVAWEALENACLPPSGIGGLRAGVYIGMTSHDYRDWCDGDPDVYWATGNGGSFAVGRVAHAMNLTGPAVAVDTACSSSLVCVHLAVQAIRRGECDVALAGGVNLILSPRTTSLVQQTRLLSPDGRCRAFDARASGFGRGEGCGVVVLKRLDRAIRDGDRVHAVIHGSAINHQGRQTGFTVPDSRSQVNLIRSALADAGLAPCDIGLIEAHGTGTPSGDAVEMEALIEALDRGADAAPPACPLHVGTVKANFGHLEAAAGIAGLIKAVLSLKHQMIAPLVHFQTLNPRISLEGAPVVLSATALSWKPGDRGQYAGVSSFGMNGTNAHIILGAAAAGKQRGTSTPPVTGFEITAKTEAALRQFARRLSGWLASLDPDEYGAFAYTVTSGRERHAIVARVAAPDKAAAQAALNALADGVPAPAVTLCTAGIAGAGACPATADALVLPRQVMDVPGYPWQRQRCAPRLTP